MDKIRSLKEWAVSKRTFSERKGRVFKTKREKRLCKLLVNAVFFLLGVGLVGGQGWAGWHTWALNPLWEGCGRLVRGYQQRSKKLLSEKHTFWTIYNKRNKWSSGGGNSQGQQGTRSLGRISFFGNLIIKYVLFQTTHEAPRPMHPMCPRVGWGGVQKKHYGYHTWLSSDAETP